MRAFESHKFSRNNVSIGGRGVGQGGQGLVLRGGARGEFLLLAAFSGQIFSVIQTYFSLSGKIFGRLRHPRGEQ